MLILLFLGLTAVAAATSAKPRPLSIVGGNETTIERYPFQASVLTTYDFSRFNAICAAIIINERSILTAAECTTLAYVQMRARVGSNYDNSGGVVHKVKKYVIHPPGLFDYFTNLAIVRLASPISFIDAQPAPLPGPDYKLGDHEMVWASGWGRLWYRGPSSKHLRHVQTWTVNQAECKSRYSYYEVDITEVMLCASWLDLGHYGLCWDLGAPLVHNGVVVGMAGWSVGCGTKYFPDIFARLSTASSWIQANA